MYLKEIGAYVCLKNNMLFNVNTLDFYELDNDAKNAILNEGLFSTNYYTLSKDNNTDEYSLRSVTNVKVHVSNDCNLRCAYCYASHGNYGTDKIVMSKDFASDLIKHIIDLFPNIKTITFFGGEPLLAVDAIEVICEYCVDKNITFLMQTNGTLYNKRIHRLIDKYQIITTVSIDGTKEVHDKYRIFPNGQGTYNLIKDNVIKINENNKNINFVQATYTNQASKKYSKEDLVQHIESEFGISNIQIGDVMVDDESEMKICTEEITEFDKTDKKNDLIKFEINDFIDDVNNLRNNNHNVFKKVFSQILSQKHDARFCNAGTSQISIDCNGGVWPCQLFVNKPDYKIGAIFDKENFSAQYKKSIDQLKVLEKDNDEECSQCIARFWCGKCVFDSTVITDNDLSIQKIECEYYRVVTETAINKIFELISNEQYEMFMANFEKNYAMELV